MHPDYGPHKKKKKKVCIINLLSLCTTKHMHTISVVLIGPSVNKHFVGLAQTQKK